MMNQVFTTLLSLSFASSVLAETEKITTQTEKKEAQDQFADFVMKGLNVSLEHSRLNADIQMKASVGRTTTTDKANTNASAPAMGIAVNYAELPRNNFGWSIGATLVNKTENDSKDYNSLKALKSFTQLRPELNVG